MFADKPPDIDPITAMVRVPTAAGPHPASRHAPAARAGACPCLAASARPVAVYATIAARPARVALDATCGAPTGGVRVGQGSEIVVGCEILNRMTALGRPVSSRIGR